MTLLSVKLGHITIDIKYMYLTKYWNSDLNKVDILEV